MINAVCAETAIRADRFERLEGDADVDVVIDGAATGYRRQSVTVLLNGLTPLEIGRFLTEFRGRQEIWTVTRIEMTHARGDRGAESTQNLYHLRIRIAASYVAALPDAAIEASRT